MNAMVQFTTLTLATLFAVAAAAAFDWVLLRFAFYLMKPATVRTRVQQRPLGTGSLRVAPAFSVRS